MGRAVAFFECPSSIVHPQEPARESPSPAAELWGVASLSQLAIVQPCVYPGKLSIRLDLQKMQTVDEHTLSRLICPSLPSQASFLLSFHLMKCRMILYIHTFRKLMEANDAASIGGHLPGDAGVAKG